MTTPEAHLFLDKARRTLAKARFDADYDFYEDAARGAYLVGFHAAQAFIFDRTGKVAKTHNGVRSEFARLAKGEPCIDRAFPAFLGKAYELKTIADYEVDSSVTVSAEDAMAAIDTAVRFVECIAGLLERPGPASHSRATPTS